MFAGESKRKINLGGSSSSSSQSQSVLFDKVKQQRELRQVQKRRNEAATMIQSHWRMFREVRKIRLELQRTFKSDVTGIVGMRCLVLLGQDEEALGIWCNAMLHQDWSSPVTESWLVLSRQISIRLLASAANKHPNSLLYLSILNALTQHPQVGAPVLRYLLVRSYYALLAQCILAYPKNTPNFPPLVPLATVAFSTFSASDPEYKAAINGLFDHIITISVLPNRLPLQTLSQFTAKLPFANISLVEPNLLLSIEARVHLIANLLTFTPPFYSTLKNALPSYVRLLTRILNSLPVGIFDKSTKEQSDASARWIAADSDDDEISVAMVTEFTRPISLPDFDARTLKRLQTLPSVAHLNALMRHVNDQKELVRFLLTLVTIWPSQRNIVLSLVSSGWMRELYRSYVRSSPLGKDQAGVLSPSNAEEWPVMLLLTEAYSQALLTMGDDEFFGTGGFAARARAGNPLSLDELASWTKQSMNIAFALYRRDRDGARLVNEEVCEGLRITWDAARDIVTKCLVAIHDRDSRRPFVKPEHWHMLNGDSDVQGFVDAAIYEEENLEAGEDSQSISGRSRKQMADLSPRLGILNNIPFTIPFEVRVSMFRAFVWADRQRSGYISRFMYPEDRVRVQIRRDRVAQDGYDRLDGINLKSPFQIEFIDQFGQPEAGIDGGGVFKEFFTSLCKEVFDTDRGLWLTNKQRELYPSPSAYAKEPHSLSWYKFVGRILGKAMYEGILVDVGFAPFFLSKLLGRQSLLDDLASLDEELWRGLMFVKHHDGDLAELALTFTVSTEDFGVTRNVDLVPNGSSTPVTKENRLQYILLVAHYKLAKQIKQQSDAFFDGLREVIQPRWLRMFNQQEVQILIGGVDTLIDFDDLRAHTNYGGLYDDKSPYIQMFWKVLESLNQEERRALLRFATSCSRPPLLGFKELVPNFSIRDAGSDELRLPTSSTCVNLLKLPMYKSPAVMKDKLVKAIMSGAGFDLS